MVIKTHADLAKHIEGKSILHLNSLGKDATLSLDWLYNFARPSRIVSINYGFLAQHPGDSAYREYLYRKYPNVKFITLPNPWELSQICIGMFQSPIDVLNTFNHLEYDIFDADKMSEELRVKYECDFICQGMSRYESFTRAVNFHKKGILQGNKIFPLGFMSKEQVLTALKASGVKLHPVYKLSAGTLDRPSYYKMRSWFKASPEYYERMKAFFPLIELDEYRYEVLFNKGV